MKQGISSSFFILAAAMACANPVEAKAEAVPDTWTFSLAPQFSAVRYRNAPQRDTMTIAGLFVDAQYLEHGGVTLGASHTALNMKNGLAALRQDNHYLSGRWNFTPDFVPGNLVLRGDLHDANNSDASNETSGVRVAAPTLSFMNYAKTLYLDIGYARSRYGDSRLGNGTLDVQQWTPTLGFGFNQGMDWVQLRDYSIHVSNARRAQNLSATNALEVKWTHYFAPGYALPEHLRLGVLSGRRIYAVDGDTASLYNLGDVQRGGVSLGAQWRIGRDATWQLNLGDDRYTSGAVDYRGRYVSAGLSVKW